ncbi:hypothetical protein G6M26_27975 [Agrobacterium tumefaciens]|nr:hypothetical protein [Agrobacterium tumefaciens]NTE22391.1 hypothetical protein [Agrobacterium tumefaciens]
MCDTKYRKFSYEEYFFIPKRKKSIIDEVMADQSQPISSGSAPGFWLSKAQA